MKKLKNQNNTEVEIVNYNIIKRIMSTVIDYIEKKLKKKIKLNNYTRKIFKWGTELYIESNGRLNSTLHTKKRGNL